MSDLSDKLRAAFEDDARVTAEDIIDVLDELEAAIVERDSIISRLEAGQSATASLERWKNDRL